MKTLRITLFLGLTGILAVACGDDDRPPVDGGPIGVVDGGGGTDGGGTGTDGGGTGTDGGMTGSSCGGDMCNLVTGGGCGAGQTCRFLSMGMGTDPAQMCVMAGTVGDGMPCTGPTDCMEGFGCAIGMDGMGTCQHYCCPDAGGTSDCPTGQLCSTSIAGSDVGFCQFPDDCDVIMQTGCPDGEACYPGMGGTTSCASPQPDAGGDGTMCMFTNDCMGGFICAGMPGTCRQACDTTATDPCPMGFTCGGLTGFDGLGICNPDM